MRRRVVRFEMLLRFRAETRCISKAFGLLLFRPLRGHLPHMGKALRVPAQTGNHAMLPYMVNIGKYTASSKITVMTARAMVMAGSRRDSSRWVVTLTSLSK